MSIKSGGDKKNKGHGRAKRVLPVIVLVLVTVIAGAVIYGIGRYQSLLDRIPRAQQLSSGTAPAQTTSVGSDQNEPSEIPAESGKHGSGQMRPARSSDRIINILVIGQSARPSESYHMADSMILVTINTDTKTMTLTSFLRDAYLKLPDYTDSSGTEHMGVHQRLNVCYHMGHSYGGISDAMAMLDQCLYENFGIEVDFNVEVGFEGVERVINYFGGVEVELTEAEAAYLNADDNYVAAEVRAGKQVLDGLAALSYARMRKVEGDGEIDINRTQRQRKLIESLMEKVKQSDAAGLERVMYDFLPYVVTDMTDEDITRCILEIFPIVPELTVETGTCPVQSTYWVEIVNIGGFSTMVLGYDEGENRKMMMALTERQ